MDCAPGELCDDAVLRQRHINDCGIVYAPGSAFVICVFTTTSDPSTGVQAIRDITRAAYHYLGH